VRWPDLSEPPADAAAWLVNPAAGTRTYLRTQHSAAVRLGAEASEDSAELQVPVRAKASGAALVTAMPAGAAGGGTPVAFTLSADARATVRLLNLAGRPIATIVTDRACAAGANSAAWNLRSTTGARVPAGRYLCVVQARAADGQSVQHTRPLQVAR
jgi:hypothetical protein